MKRTTLQRFEDFIVAKSYEDCWLWGGYIKPEGYGHFRDGVKTVRAHRWAYEFVHGAIPGGMQLDHLCRVRHCVNPNHLEPVTPVENTRRGETGEAARKRQLAKTHCPQNHPYHGDNLYIVPSTGKRNCRECRRISKLRHTVRAKLQRGEI